jgi:hypothetical protein
MKEVESLSSLELMKFTIDQANEKWLPIPGYENEYEISTLGNVDSLARKHVPKRKRMKSHLKTKGIRKWIRLRSSYGQRENSIAHLVALTFVANPEGCRYVRFKDNDASNHKYTNLFWSNSNINTDVVNDDVIFRDGYEEELESKGDDGAWMLSSNRAYFQNNKQAILQQIINEKS